MTTTVAVPGLRPTTTTWATRVPVFAVMLGVGLALSTSSAGKLLAILIVMAASVYLSVRAVILGSLVMFVFLDDPGAAPYNGLWESPIQYVAYFWNDNISTSVPGVPIPLAPALAVASIALLRAATGHTGTGLAYEKPTVTLPKWFGTSILLGYASLIFFTMFGVGTGGDAQQAPYQIGGMLIALAMLGATATVTTPRFADLVWRIVFVAAVYRAFLAIYIWWTISRGLPEQPLYLTTHLDSLIWALALLWLISRLVEQPTSRARQMLLVFAPFIMYALVVNNRRLAWVVLSASLFYFVITTSPEVTRRLRSISTFAVPFFAVYALAGFVAPPSPAFAPVQSLKSVVVGDDSSSQTRDIEDFNLVFTMKSSFPLPTGFGKEYIELVQADDISTQFPQYRYLPHNSFLGMLMMAGPVGTALMLAPFAGAVYVAHNLRRRASDVAWRTWLALTVATWIGFLNHAWGDLGFYTNLTVAMLGISCGIGVGLAGHRDAPAELEGTPS